MREEQRGSKKGKYVLVLHPLCSVRLLESVDVRDRTEDTVSEMACAVAAVGVSPDQKAVILDLHVTC
jgi:hypothetical protein